MICESRANIMANEVSKTYRKLNQREHVLLRPGMYVGSTEEDTCTAWVLDNDSSRMVSRTVRYVPGLYKIFDEILMNAVDHSVRLRRQKTSEAYDAVVVTRRISVTVDRETGIISVENDGDGIDVELHSEHGVHIPELIFGHLLTSANYDDAMESGQDGRTIGGQNGIGAKACNIFSKWFEVETVDHKRKRVYNQMFRDNMATVDPPSTKYCTKKPYTRIRFLPDYERFGPQPPSVHADAIGQCLMSNDMYALMKRRVYDVTAVTASDVSVSFNDIKIECKTFERYVDMYIGTKSQGERVYERINDWWEVAASLSDGTGLQHVSFVNGMSTIRGGKHVDHVVNQICRRIVEMIGEKRKGTCVKSQYVRDNLFVFVRATIPSPTFDSQTKETLTTPVCKFGTKVELSDRFIEKLFKTDIVQRAVGLSSVSTVKSLAKTDGKIIGTLTGITKLDDATWAGTKRGVQCTLILTEGDSAKTMAIAGLAEVGRERYGVFPLRGKLMNVCDMTAQKVADNTEIANIKKILGLESGKEYTNRNELRYGRVMIMTDQDLDGSHIKGLLMNMFHQLWPSLLRLDGFLASMLTPIVKAQRVIVGGKRKTDEIPESRCFYNISDMLQWQSVGSEGSEGKWRIKYYKGLGTSTAIEAREYFKRMRVAVYTWDDDGRSRNALDLAFNKKRADDRKTWLQSYDRGETLDYGIETVGFDEFVNRDLIHFSNYDVERSIPSVVDGLKISQRKVMFACFKRKLVTEEIRVAQLAGYVSEHAAYHHGETSLVGTIVNLAQNYVGSNNINLLVPSGQFGTRLHGGKDAASARYIHTRLSSIASCIFKTDDEPLLEYLVDDGEKVEPRTFLPVIPMVLVNGALGIGTGFSTNVPSYNPMDIMDCVRKLIYADVSTHPDDVDIEEDLLPWFQGFSGTIERSSNGKLYSRGCYERVGPTKIRVTELPIGSWTQDFKEMLDGLLSDKGDLRKVDGSYTDTKVDFVLTYASEASLDGLLLDVANSEPRSSYLEASLRLVSNKGLSLTNRYLFGPSGCIKSYKSTREIIVDFYKVRLKAYHTRRTIELSRFRVEASIARSKVRFVSLVATSMLRMDGKSKVEVEDELKNVHSLESMYGSYDHLLKMPMGSMTKEYTLTLEKRLQSIESKLATLEMATARDMWIADLAAFDYAYALFKTSSHDECYDVSPLDECTIGSDNDSVFSEE